MISRSIFVCLFILLATHGHAQFDRLGVDDIKEQDKVHLLSNDVSTVSKVAEDIDFAPGVISVISRKEIDEFGANNLLDVLERVVSLYHTGSYFAPNNVLALRGDLNTLYNNHVLILINGRPVREGATGGVDFPIFNAISVNNIDRIEIVRGPGSVLYGTNAYTGVVNVITGAPIKTNQKGYAKGTLGSFGTIGIEGGSTYSKEDLYINYDLKFLRQDGWKASMVTEDVLFYRSPDTLTFFPDSVYNYSYFQNNISASFLLKYKNLTINAMLTNSLVEHLSILPISNELYIPGGISIGALYYDNRQMNGTRGFLDIGYDLRLNPKNNITFNATLNTQDITYAYYTRNPWVGNSIEWIFEATHFSNPIKGLNTILGANVYWQKGIAEVGNVDDGIPLYDKAFISAYAQADYRPIPALKFIAGGQLNKANNLGWDFVPRIGMIGKIDQIGIKLLYGQSYRSPTEFERNLVAAPVLAGNQGLKPERVGTFDAQVFYSKPDAYRIALSYFNTSQTDLITQSTPAPGEVPQYINSGNNKLSGLELESKFVNFKKAFLTVGASYQQNKLNDSIENHTLVPQGILKIGIIYNPTENLSISLFDSYYFDVPSMAEVQATKGASVAMVNPEVTKFHYVTAKLSYDMSGLFKIKGNQKIKAQLFGTNLLNESIQYPEFVRRNINSMPGRSGRAVWYSLKMEF